MLVINNLLRKLQFTGSSIYREVLRCGDFYDRMVGIAKNAICKTLGRKEFSFFAPKEVVLECKFILTLIRLAFLMVVFILFLRGSFDYSPTLFIFQEGIIQQQYMTSHDC